MALHRDLESLAEAPQAKAREAFAVLDSAKIPYYVNETYREQAVQDAYYAQGRESIDKVNELRHKAGLGIISEKENKNIITHAKVSKHSSGLALDICPMTAKGYPWWNAPKAEYEKIAKVMKLYGFEWGGDWTGGFVDLPHYEYKGV